jgi:proteasome alpha subunit
MEWLRYDQPLGVEALTKEITDHIQQYTQTGGARPFGVALLVAGVEDGEPRLFETDPSGTPYEWSAVAVGGGREDIQAYLEDNYGEALSLGDGIGLALEALAAASEGDLDPSSVEIATVDVESEAFEAKTPEEAAELVEEHGLAEEGEDE